MSFEDKAGRSRTNFNVYLLGAGFSAPRGIPVIRGFLNAARDAQEWLQGAGYSREYDSIGELLRFRRHASAAAERMQIDLENIEDLFSLASATPDALNVDHIIRSVAGTIEYSRQAGKEYTKRLPCLQSLLAPAGWSKVPNAREGAAIYDVPAYDYACGTLTDHFGSRQYEQSVFISLNYDTVLEDVLSRLGVPFNLGFKPGSVDYPDWSPLADRPGVMVLKLHGSTSWARVQDSKRLAVFRSYDSLSKANLVPTIVPPTWKKQADETLLEIWEQALDAIASATRLIVIGYSFPTSDQNLKYLLAAGLMSNNALRSIIVWDKHPKTVEARLGALLRPELAERGVLSFRSADIGGAFDSADTRKEIGRPFRDPYLDRD